MPTEVMYRSGYNSDGKAQRYLGAVPFQVLPAKDNYKNIFTDTNEAKLDLELTGMGVMVLDYGSDYYIKKLLEMATIIRDQQARLEIFERKLNFVPSGLVLPDDYYDDLVE